MKIGVTGHRPNKLGGYFPNPIQDYCREHLKNTLQIFHEFYPGFELVSGMALGADQWAVEVAIDLGIPFIAAVPCEAQECKWPLSSQVYYGRLLNEAKEVVVVTDGPYASWKMMVRNEYIVDNSEWMIAVWDGDKRGGTYNCLQYAHSQKKNIVHIDPTKSQVDI